MAKKSFTKADGAIDKFFTAKPDEQANITHNVNVSNVSNDSHKSKYTYISNNTNNTKPTNKSKHYDERGKRGERFGLLLDRQLKEDLTNLSMATGSKSVNDLIVTVLLEFTEREDNASKLLQYKKLLQG